MADRRHRGPRPSKADDALQAQIDALEARLDESERKCAAVQTVALEALARAREALELLGRPSTPPPKA